MAGEDVSNPDQQYSCQLKVPTGPTQVYVYASTGDKNSTDRFKNTFGKFIIGSGADSATYWWKGQGPTGNPNNQHSDTLTFQSRVTINDTRPDTDHSVDGWLYEATDGTGSKWWIVFGEDPLTSNPANFPIYYSFSDPSQNKFLRWLTYSGTKRL